MSDECQHKGCNRITNVKLRYYMGMHWVNGIEVCSQHSSINYDKYPSPAVTSAILAEHDLIKVMDIKNGKHVIIKDGPIYPTSDKENNKYTGYTSKHPPKVLELRDKLKNQNDNVNKEPKYIPKTNTIVANIKEDVIDTIIKKMSSEHISKDEMLKIAETDNILSVIVRINAKLKKLGLKLSKKSKSGKKYYSIGK